MKSLRTLLTALAAALLAAPALAQPEPEARVIVRFKAQADSVRAPRPATLTRATPTPGTSPGALGGSRSSSGPPCSG